MRAQILTTGVSVDADLPSSIEHATLAGQRCIEAAGIDPQEVNFIFNVGVYRDHNMVEPSMAALTQKGIGINRDFTRFPVSSPAFSTDLMNGATGALNAFHVADSLFRAGRTGYILVLSSDAHPSGTTPEGFPVRPCGAAVLLRGTDDERGFAGFRFEDSSGSEVGQSSYVDFRGGNIDGRNSITVDTAPDFHDRLVEFAARVGRDFVADNAVDLGSTRLVVPTFTKGFAGRVAERIGCPQENVIDPWERLGNTHTSAFGIGLDLALASEKGAGAAGTCDAVLMLGAGAGLSAGCALYRAGT